jgi:hypothetical protein
VVSVAVDSSALAALRVTTPAITTVTRTTTSVALSRSSSKMPTSVPMVTAASVAAAWEGLDYPVAGDPVEHERPDQGSAEHDAHHAGRRSRSETTGPTRRTSAATKKRPFG